MNLLLHKEAYFFPTVDTYEQATYFIWQQMEERASGAKRTQFEADSIFQRLPPQLLLLTDTLLQLLWLYLKEKRVYVPSLKSMWLYDCFNQ